MADAMRQTNGDPVPSDDDDVPSIKKLLAEGPPDMTREDAEAIQAMVLETKGYLRRQATEPNDSPPVSP